MDHYKEDHRIHGRFRVVLISVLSSGIVALSISWMAETSIYNSQADRSRKNCYKIQAGFGSTAEIASDVARDIPTPEGRVKWEGYAKKFNDIIPPQAPTCVEQFPKRTIIPFIDG